MSVDWVYTHTHLDDVLPRFLQLFTGVFGVGPKTAEQWFCRGLRSFADVLAEPRVHLNRMQRSGAAAHTPTSKPTCV